MPSQAAELEGRSIVPGAGLPTELTSFVGRRRERADVRKALADARLVTLTGFGGVGKTRLSQRVAADVRRAFPGGLWFVGLAELREPELLGSTVAAQLGLLRVATEDVIGSLVRFIGQAEALLVLDNCEHIIDAAAAVVGELLAACPRLHILATSREPLHLIGEAVFPVAPLSVPGNGHPAGEPLHHYEAVNLFLDRARAVVPGFELDEGNRATVAQVCQQLQGIPLAVELAAVWLRVLSPVELLARLSDQRRLLTMGARNAPDRQRTLDACVAWSYDLCAPAERDLWARAAVFRGGFEIDAVERLYDEADDGIVLDRLLALTDKSILVREERHGHGRYRMLESIRDYGHARLAESGRLDEMRRRQRDWCSALAARFEHEFLGPRQTELMTRLSMEQANLETAVDYCAITPGEAETGLAMLAPLHDFFVGYGLLTQGRHWIGRLLAAPGEPSTARISAIRTVVWLASMQGDLDAAGRLVETGRELSHALGASATTDMDQAAGLHAMFRGDLVAATDHLQRAADAYRVAGSRLREAETSILLCQTHCYSGQFDRALAAHERCLAITQPSGEWWLRSMSLWIGGLTKFAMGDADEATKLEQESLRVHHQTEDRLGIALCLDALGAIAAKEDAVRSARLFGAADRAWQAIGTSIMALPGLGLLRTEAERTLRRQLGSGKFADEHQRGFALDSAAALEFALSGKVRGRADGTGNSGAPSPLTKREREIAELVARGMTNRDIATSLVIGVRTVDSHVEHILTKLGFTSRTQIATWIAEQRSA